MNLFKIIILACICIIGACGTPAFSAEKSAEKTLLIDVRTEQEWNQGHLEGALLIPYETIGAAIEKVAPDRKAKIYLYCRSGRRSGIALDTLKKLGYENVSNEGSLQSASETLHIPVVK